MQKLESRLFRTGRDRACRVARWNGPLWLILMLALLGLGGQAQEPGGLRLEVALDSGIPWLSGPVISGDRQVLESSGDLIHWTEEARVLDRLHPYSDWTAAVAGAPARYYRLGSMPRSDADDWANQLDLGSPQLFRPGGTGAGSLASVKWTVMLDRLGRVFFQDSVRYPYHIQFARARLPGYAGMGVLEFNAQSLYARDSQRMVLGSVFRAPDPQVREVGIEITGAEAFPAAKAVQWVDAVRGRLAAAGGWRVFYMPSTEQRSETEAHPGLFAARGIEVSNLGRWISTPVCYSAGWALGRLVRVNATDIPAALADGRLRFDDLLVTDRIPSELPVLAGYLSLEPATPNSHVALLARSLLLPFAYASGAGLQAELESLIGRDVLVVVEETDGVCRIRLEDATGRLTPEQRREILDRKRGGPLAITPTARKGVYTLPVDPLTPADLRFVGGKAANFGFLRRSIPDESPSPVLAITFDLWNDYLEQEVSAGVTLRQFIVSRLAGHTYPPEVARLRADLEAVRSQIESGADFTLAQRAAILAALEQTGLRGAPVRFRSSTNVEDGETFNGAGLYDSFSGCVEDDTDGDTTGPSHCDPSESRERGVFRALRKVFASFYNENAFLERLRYGVRESEVGMAVLVHFSSPDPLEMANGVSTLAVETGGPVRTASARIVSQAGAESVTNPDGSVVPEVVRAEYTADSTDTASLQLEQASSLTPGGAPVMTWEADYRTLVRQMNTVARAYEQYYPDKSEYELDFEFKRLVPGRVGLKQVRAVPHPVPVPPPVLP